MRAIWFMLFAGFVACAARTAHPPRLPPDIEPTRAIDENEAIRIALENNVASLYEVRIAWAELVAATQRVKQRAYLIEQIRLVSTEVERLREADRAERAMHEKQIARDRLCTVVGLGACALDVRLDEPSLAMPPDDDAPGDVRIAREELRMAIGSYDVWHRAIGPHLTIPAEIVEARLHEIDLALDIRRARAKLER